MHTTRSARLSPVTLIVADDHPPFVDGVARVLPERCSATILARCADGRAALDAILAHAPDIALLDLRMPMLGGRAVLGEVVRLRLATRVIVCSAHGEPAVVRAVLEDGARGYLDKTASWDEICVAVQSVARGGTWVSPQLQAGLNGELASPQRAPSERELEVIRLAALGLTDLQIADRMYISRETVRTNLKRCSEKLGVSGRATLVAAALRRGLIE
jgi:two-component system, NarL family, nitrate/nitrite response regulator NarL